MFAGLIILVLCILSAVLYGVVHDQVTVRVCLEYFTIGHPRVFHTDSPTLLALGWGVIATWWVGLILGVPVAVVSRIGSKPKMDAKRLLKPVGILLLSMACLSLLAGIVGYVAAKSGWVWLLEPLASKVPADKHHAFIADLWAHLASYAVGFLGGVGLCCWIWRRRERLVKEQGELGGSLTGDGA